MNACRDIEPWRTVIREVEVPTEHTEAMVAEVLITDLGQKGEKVEEKNVVREAAQPMLATFIEEVVVPEMLRYVKDVWGHEPDEYRSVSWIRSTSDGGDLQPHHHATPLVSAVLYLEGASGELSLMDPRGTAERGLPSSVRGDHFGVYQHTPRNETLVIFPSYLFHYVVPHAPALRIAVPTDLYFN